MDGHGGVDLEHKTITLASGETESFDYLVSTMPLDTCLRSLTGHPELRESPDKPVDAGTIVGDVIAGLESCGFIDRSAVISRWHRRLEHGYPTPWLGRDEVLAPVNAALQSAGVFSRGRFGAWKYEVSNQDHSVMQGVEVVKLPADRHARAHLQRRHVGLTVECQQRHS